MNCEICGNEVDGCVANKKSVRHICLECWLKEENEEKENEKI